MKTICSIALVRRVATLAILALCTALLHPLRAESIALVQTGAVWRYLDTGMDPGTAWRTPGFDDRAWPSGPAQLGYGDGDEATVVGYGPNPSARYITTYFRRSFVLADASAVTNLLLRVLYDDGAVVYVNGTEAVRVNLPAGVITFSTLASTAAENALFSSTISPGVLANGTNVVAVEVHQNTPSSSDLSFDFELLGASRTVVPPPFVVRHIDSFHFTVRLTAAPPASVTGYLVEEQLPPPFWPANISHSGVFDPTNRLVRFGPFNDHEARTLSYVVDIPIGDCERPKVITGQATADGIVTPILGDVLFGPIELFPADLAPTDGWVSSNEVAAYSAAWRQGQSWPLGQSPVSLDYVSRAAALWQGNDAYCFDPRTITNPPTLRWLSFGAPFPACVRYPSPLPTGTVESQLPATYVPAQPIMVVLTVTPAANVAACTVEDQPPAGWIISDISDGGVFDASSGKVKFGPFLGLQVRSLSYRVTPPSDVQGDGVFVGAASFDGATVPITGMRTIRPVIVSTWAWAQSAGGAGADFGRMLLADAIGNTYVAGEFTSPASFGNQVLYGGNIFVAKYDFLGNRLRWVKQARGAGTPWGTALDAQGNLYVVGKFDDQIAFESVSLMAECDDDCGLFIVKYDANSNLEWAKSGPALAAYSVPRLVLDGAGNVFVAGEFVGSTAFGSHPLVSEAEADVFLAKLNGAGDVLWARQSRSRGASHYGLALDAAGNPVLIGVFWDWASFENAHLTNAPSRYNSFVVKYDSAGTLLWAKQSEPGDAYAHHVAIDSEGRVIIAGSFQGTTTFDGHSLTSRGRSDVFVVQFDAGGAVRWAKQAGGTAEDRPYHLVTDRANNVFVAGTFSGTAVFDTQTLVNVGPEDDFFIAKYEASANLRWVRPVAGDSRIWATRLLVDSEGRAYLGGHFTGTLQIGAHTLVSAGGQDLFLAKYGPEGTVLLPGQAGGTNDDVDQDWALDGRDHVYVTGYAWGSAWFGAHNITNRGHADIFLAKLNAEPTPPRIVMQPVSQTNFVGRTVCLYARATGTEPISLQWLFKRRPVTTEANWSGLAFVLTNIQFADAGEYWVVASNALGAVTSQVATLTVLPPPVHPGALDPSFQARLDRQGDAIGAMVKQADGKLIVGGEFYGINGVPRLGLARLNFDGSLDATFDAGLGGGVEALALQSDGKILVGGSFSQVNGVSRQGLARLHADGTLDPSFAPSLPVFARVSAVATQPDGKVLAAVEGFTTNHNLTHLLRLLPDGSMDAGFPVTVGDASDASIRAIVLQPDGKILVGGSFQTVDGVSRRSLARLNSNGTMDPSLNVGDGIFYVADLALQPDGRIVIAGGVHQIGQVVHDGVVRLMPDGSRDTSFTASVSCCLHVVALQPDGKILIGGGFGIVNGVERRSVARLEPDGSVDLSFNSGSGLGPFDDSSVLTMLVQDDGKIVIAGTEFVAYDGFACGGLARLYGDSVLSPPRITTQPVSQTNFVGSTVMFTVTTTGTPAATFQWQKDGANLNGQTSTTLTLVNVQLTDAGRYRVIVSNAAGSVTSAEAVLTVLPNRAGPGSLDPSFRISLDGPGNVHVLAIAKQPDGKLLIGGEFASINGVARSSLARLMPDGTVDTSFNVAINDIYCPTVRALAVQADGKIIVGGYFTNVNGVARGNVARLNPDGSLDGGVNAPASTFKCVTAVAFQSDGKILVAGQNYEAGHGVGVLIRLNRDGSLDPSYSLIARGGYGIVAMVVQPDDKALIAGEFGSVNGVGPASVSRINPDGTVDLSFAPEQGGELYGLALQPDGKILISGYVSGSLVRLNSDGTRDPSFVSAGGVPPDESFPVLQGDGRILVGGRFGEAAFPDVSFPGVRRLSHDGSVDASFDPGTGVEGGTVKAILVQDDGQIVVGGYFDRFDGVPCRGLVRLNGDAGIVSVVPAIVRQPVGQARFVGQTATFVVEATGTPPLSYLWFVNGTGHLHETNSTLVLHRVQLTQDGTRCWVVVSNAFGSVTSVIATLTVVPFATGPGSLDLSFDPGLGPDGEVRAVVVQPDGKVLIGGQFTSADGHPRFGLARLNEDGSLNATFNPGTGLVGVLWSMAVQPDGRLLIGGAFTNVNSVARNSIARLNPDGSVDPSFNPGYGVTCGPGACPGCWINCEVRRLLVQPDGKVLIGGRFEFINGVARPGFARLNVDGSLDAPFNPVLPTAGGEYGFCAMALQPDGKILVGGEFYNPDATLLRFNADGTPDASFNYDGGPQGNKPVMALAVQPDSKIIIGGDFDLVRLNSDGSRDTTFNSPVALVLPYGMALQPDGKIVGVFSSGLTRVNADGTPDAEFHDAAVSWIWTVALQPDGRILLGGVFETVNGFPIRNIARLHGDDFTPPSVFRLSYEYCEQSWYAGQTVMYFLQGRGTPPLTYQWFYEGSPIAGATNPTLVLPQVQHSQEGSYYAVVSNVAGTVTSEPFHLGVLPTPAGPGTVDATFHTVLAWEGPDVDRGPGACHLVKQPDGGVLIGGFFSSVNGIPHNHFARLRPDGSPDFSFSPQLPTLEYVSGIAVQPDGKFIVLGLFNTGSSWWTDGMTRLNVDGTLDTNFAPALDLAHSSVRQVVVQPDGKLVVRGWLTLPGQSGTNRIVRLHPDGSLDTSFQFEPLAIADLNAMTLQSDGKLILGRAQGPSPWHPLLLRLNSDGSVDSGFHPEVQGGLVDQVAVQPDGKLLVGGEFDRVRDAFGDVNCTNLARLNPDGTVDRSFVSGVPDLAPYVITLQPDGRILVGGHGDRSDRVLARLHPNGSLDTSFVSGTIESEFGGGNGITAITLQEDGRVLVGGYFIAYHDGYAPGLTRLNSDVVIPTPFVQRQLPYQGGTMVRLVAQPASGVAVYAVEDQPPTGWQILNISHGGVFDTTIGKVKFGPFNDAELRTLSYDAVPPLWGIYGVFGVFTFSGIASADGVSTPVLGDQQLTIAGLMPMDRNPADHNISINEVTGYGAAWRRGEVWPIGPNPIPINYVTRAGALWRWGECYTVDRSVTNEPLWWVPCQGRTGVSPVLKNANALTVVTSAESPLPSYFVPGEPFTVIIRTTPATGVGTYAVEDTVPAGWSIADLSQGGLLDAANQRVKWGPFFDSNPRMLSYRVTPPATANGSAAFEGVASFDGTSMSVAGSRQLRAGSRLTLTPSAGNTGLALRLQGELGRSYVIETSTDLVAWEPLTALKIVEAGVTLTIIPKPTEPHRFYRVQPAP